MTLPKHRQICTWRVGVQTLTYVAHNRPFAQARMNEVKTWSPGIFWRLSVKELLHSYVIDGSCPCTNVFS